MNWLAALWGLAVLVVRNAVPPPCNPGLEDKSDRDHTLNPYTFLVGVIVVVSAIVAMRR